MSYSYDYTVANEAAIRDAEVSVYIPDDDVTGAYIERVVIAIAI